MKRLRINKDQMERGQGQDKQKKVVNRMSSNEEEIQVTLMTVRPGETEKKPFSPRGSVSVTLAASGTFNLPFPCFLSLRLLGAFKGFMD